MAKELEVPFDKVPLLFATCLFFAFFASTPPTAPPMTATVTNKPTTYYYNEPESFARQPTYPRRGLLVCVACEPGLNTVIGLSWLQHCLLHMILMIDFEMAVTNILSHSASMQRIGTERSY